MMENRKDASLAQKVAAGFIIFAAGIVAGRILYRVLDCFGAAI